MYEVKIINDGNETLINAVSTSFEAPRITGQCKFGINEIDSFTFTILPNNQGYDLLKDLQTLVEIKNIKTNKTEFKGRIVIQTPDMSSSGLLSKSVICESELGYLMDSVQEFEECHNITVRGFLELIIDNHNKQVSEDKHFTVGIVDVIDNNDSLYRFLGYDKTLDTIKDKLIDRLGGELRIRYKDGVRYLDYIQAIGEKKDTEIVLARNLVTIEQERDPSDIITRLIPLGAKLEDSDERLTISSINNGLNYIDDEEAISKFGIIVDTVTYDDVTIVENLLRKGKEYLKENNKIKKKHKVTALDLSTIGLDVDSFEVGNIYRVVNPLMNIDEDLRVIEKTLDINSPQSSSLSIGDKFEDIKDYQLSIEKTSVKAGSEANEARAKANYVETYATDEIYRIDARINTVTVEVGDKFDNLANVAKTGKYSDLLDKPTKLSEFQNDIEDTTIFSSLNTTNKTVIGAINELFSLIKNNGNSGDSGNSDNNSGVTGTTGIKVEPTSVNIKVNETADVIISFGDDVTNKTINVVNNSTSIVGISDLGNYIYRITGVGQGQATIMFRTSDSKFETLCSIIVSDSSSSEGNSGSGGDSGTGGENTETDIPTNPPTTPPTDIPTNPPTDSPTTEYIPNLSQFGISTIATPVKNSNGFNALIDYASKNNLTNITLPSKAEYIISKDIPIKLKSNIKFNLNGSTIKIEPNNKNGSQIVIIENCVNTELLNGTIEGDRYTHDYATYNPTTQSHEFNVGVKLEKGSKNCKIDNITFKKLTGYGLYTSQGTALAHAALDKKLLESGSYFDNGDKISDGTKIRYSSPISLSSFKGQEYLQVGTYLNYQDYLFNSTRDVTIYFYNGNSFISKTTAKLYRPITLPSGATQCRLVFHQSNPADILDGNIYKLDIFTMDPPRNCEITNCTFDDNRCLGAAICGGWKIKLKNNTFKNTSANPNSVPNAPYQAGKPGYGIDIEDGWEGTQDLIIEGNTFENNAFGDLVSMAGDNTLIKNNNFTGRVYMYSRNTNYTIENNTFTNAIATYETEKDYGATIRNNTYNSCTVSGKYHKKPKVSAVVFERETITGKGNIQLDTSMPLRNSNINLDGTASINMIGKFINCKIDGVDAQTSSTSYSTGIEIENSTITNSNFFVTRNSVFNKNDLTKFRIRLDGGNLGFTNNTINSKPLNENMPILQLRGGGTATIQSNTIKQGLDVKLYTNEGNVTVITSGSSGSNGGSTGGGSNSENTQGGSNSGGITNHSETAITQQYSSSHEAIPNNPNPPVGAYNWLNKPRINPDGSFPQSSWNAIGHWMTTYKVQGSNYYNNVGLLLQDPKAWIWNTTTKSWDVLSEDFEFGTWYREDFWDDGSGNIAGTTQWQNGVSANHSKWVKIKQTSETNGRCFHPWGYQKNWRSNSNWSNNGQPYIVTKIDFKLIKWNENGVDNLDKAKLVINSGADWWRNVGDTWQSDWSTNRDMAVGKYILATKELKRAWCTNLPQNWQYGLPK